MMTRRRVRRLTRGAVLPFGLSGVMVAAALLYSALVMAQSTPSASISGCPLSVDEGESFSCAITLSGAVPATDTDGITVYLGVDDAGATSETSVTVPSGSDSIRVRVIVADDEVERLGARVVVSIIDRMDAEYSVGSPSTATISVQDNDGFRLPSATIVAAPNPADEGEAITLTVSLDEAVGEYNESGVFVSVTVEDSLPAVTEDPETDTIESGVVIESGGDTGTFEHAVGDDDVYTENRTITFTIAEPGTEYGLGDPYEVVVVVVDDDAPPTPTPTPTLTPTPTPTPTLTPTATATATPEPEAPSRPTGLTGTATANGITLSWNVNPTADDVVSYQVSAPSAGI